MIDYADYQPPYHYESMEIKSAALLQKERVKQDAYKAMEKLEGWCTQYKASILIDLIYQIEAKTVVEVGVWGGKSLIPMAYALKGLGSGIAYGIDQWSETESANGMDGVNLRWWSSVDHEAIYQGLVNKIHEFKLGRQIQLVRSSSEAAEPIANIDLLHIDGNHSEKTSLYDVCKWVPLVRSGGIIIFDDTTWGTTGAAVQWLNNNCIKLSDHHEKNDWGVWMKP
jgi:predicted O-methyltransferase YrrM